MCRCCLKFHAGRDYSRPERRSVGQWVSGAVGHLGRRLQAVGLTRSREAAKEGAKDSVRWTFFEYEYEYRPPGRTEYEYEVSFFGCAVFCSFRTRTRILLEPWEVFFPAGVRVVGNDRGGAVSGQSVAGGWDHAKPRRKSQSSVVAEAGLGEGEKGLMRQRGEQKAEGETW